MSQITYLDRLVIGERPTLDKAVPRICGAPGCLNSAISGENWCYACAKRKGVVIGQLRQALKDYRADQKEPVRSRRSQGEFAQVLAKATHGAVTIYVIRSGSEGPVKIGKTRDLPKRLDSLQTASPKKLEVLALIEAPPELETQLHAYLDEYRMEGEWFKPHSDVMEAVSLLSEANLDGLLTKFEQRLQENEATR